jgi:hypothetical protein
MVIHMNLKSYQPFTKFLLYSYYNKLYVKFKHKMQIWDMAPSFETVTENIKSQTWMG